MNDPLSALKQSARIWQGHQPAHTSQPVKSTGYRALDNQLGELGWLRGALSECLLNTPGIGELHLLLPLMQRLTHSEKTVFWLSPPCIPYAPARARARAREGADLDQWVVIHTQDSGDFLWTLENCRRSPVAGLVVAWPGKLALRDVRRWPLKPAATCAYCFANAAIARKIRRRYPEGTPLQVQALIHKELGLISKMQYEHCFLTIEDIVAFARGRGILSQGRGSAANSAVCYCLGITEVDPAKVDLLFERFVSKDRNEPPDIDVDFEHQLREEVIQYIHRRRPSGEIGAHRKGCHRRPYDNSVGQNDLESLGLMKVDVLALGILTAIRKALEMIAPS
jgi:hypothetical protein